jgi:hypothetical protein
MQQHSYPSHSMHFVFPAAPPSGFTIELMVEEATEPGPLRFTSWEEVLVHMLLDLGMICQFLAVVEHGEDEEERRHTVCLRLV